MVITEEMKQRSHAIHQTTQELNIKIAALERYLGGLPGRMPATIDIGNGMALTFCRSGKIWRLIITEHNGDSPIISASVKAKVAAMQKLPELMAAINNTQNELLIGLLDAVESLDRFTKKLPGFDPDIITEEI